MRADAIEQGIGDSALDHMELVDVAAPNELLGPYVTEGSACSYER
jgi:hypothetical protein